MDTSVRIILGVALLVVLRLGFKMALGKAGRGRVTDRKGLTVVRTILNVHLGIMLVWYLTAPETIPDALKFHPSEGARQFGLALFILGMSIRVWCQKILGSQWSADLSTKAEHELIQSGPYAVFFHPIYASYFIIAPGLLLSTGNWLLGGFALAYVLVSVARIPAEEAMLREHFGPAHDTYRIRVSNSSMFPVSKAKTKMIVVPLFLLNLFGEVWGLLLL